MTLNQSLLLSIVAYYAAIVAYLYAYKHRRFFSLSTIAFLLTITLTSSLLTFVMQKDFSQFIPLPATALVVNIFFGRKLASVISFPLLVLLAFAGILDTSSAIVMAAASAAAICSYSKQRHDLVFTGLLIAITQVLGFLASLAFAPPSSGINGFAGLGKMIVLEFAGGIISSIIAIGSLPFLENIFGLLTPFRLLELTSGDQPLLRKLEIEAPGTYQHSLAVANLAEAGARAIGADSNLTRAGALYHDLGKSVSPKYFIENQLGDKNPHDEIAPEQSREKVLSHVKDGVDLAQRYGLPKTIIDFIPMHQGTSLMAYFYHKACLRDGVDKVNPAAYRYPGPKPNSKETAIVMLADVAEAVTHSMEDPSLEEIDAALTTVFENRYQDGQLNQSSLNYEELQLVKAAFVRVWRTLHHERLKYPTTTTGKMAVPPQAVPPPK